MYEFISGNLVTIYPTAIVVENNEIGYLISVPNPYRLQTKLNQKVKVLVHQVIREDSHTLYGFLSIEEKDLFKQLVSVSGIGPKSALSILASDDHDGLIRAVQNADVTYLTRFPGVGKKTAQQIILDLKDKLLVNVVDQEGMSSSEGESVLVQDSSQNKVLSDTQEALIGLGYSFREIKKIWKQMEDETYPSTQEALSKAFTLLMKG
ncbi:Holliday junction branch migration protein RuvA [Granulicatella seriolae]|uniref:Holliday junction branch migration complex subunit RuvA n=1 Tax=Granulicatella seriolae TaxID=2967226 RepID=A0ABT1WMZ0_9LACT|nr:Holliday junction branch migration protein RuvA [Granulicatella seriolae]